MEKVDKVMAAIEELLPYELTDLKDAMVAGPASFLCKELKDLQASFDELEEDRDALEERVNEPTTALTHEKEKNKEPDNRAENKSTFPLKQLTAEESDHA
jgi:hypothetical protein